MFSQWTNILEQYQEKQTLLIIPPAALPHQRRRNCRPRCKVSVFLLTNTPVHLEFRWHYVTSDCSSCDVHCLPRIYSLKRLSHCSTENAKGVDKEFKYCILQFSGSWSFSGRSVNAIVFQFVCTISPKPSSWRCFLYDNLRKWVLNVHC